MKQIFISKYGPPEVLKVREVPDPEPGEGEVRIKINFAGVNFAEVMARMRLYPGAPKPPAPLGSEGSGIVESMGPNVTNLKLGDPVIILSKFNTYATYAVVPVKKVIPLPTTFSLEQGAALPIVYITAYMMMFEQGNLKSGQTYLIHGAGGGVGTAAIQLAKAVGAKTIGTASKWKHDKLKDLGLDYCIDYNTEDVFEKVMDFTDGCGVDLVTDPLGGNSWKTSYKCLAPLGKIIVFGNQTIVSGFKLNPIVLFKELLNITKFSPVKLIPQNKGIMGYHLGYLDKAQGRVKSAILELLKLGEDGKISPIVDKVFPYTNAPAAHRYMQERKNFGKILIDFREAD